MKALYPPLTGTYNHQRDNRNVARHYGWDPVTGRSPAGNRTVSLKRRAGSGRTKRHGLRLMPPHMAELASKWFYANYDQADITVRPGVGVVVP